MIETADAPSYSRVDDIVTNLCARNLPISDRPTLIDQTLQRMGQYNSPETLLTDLIEGVIQFHAPYREQPLHQHIAELGGKASNWLETELMNDTLTNPNAACGVDQANRIYELRIHRSGIYSDMQLNQADGACRTYLFRKLVDRALQDLGERRLPEQGVLHQAKRLQQDIDAWNDWLATSASRLLTVAADHPESATFQADAMQRGVTMAHQLHTRLTLLKILIGHIDGNQRLTRTGMLYYDGHQLMLETLATTLIAADTALGHRLSSRMEPLAAQYHIIEHEGAIENLTLVSDLGAPVHTLTMTVRDTPEQHLKMLASMMAPYIALSDLITDARKTLHQVNQAVAKIMRSPAYQQYIEAQMKQATGPRSAPESHDYNDTL